MPIDYVDELVTPPSVEPVTLYEAKRACDEDDNYRDADYTAWITEAREAVEHDARVSLINTTFKRYLHRFPTGDQIRIDAVFPLSSVTQIQYLDTAGTEQTLATSVYKVDANRACIWLKSGQSWPNTYDEANAVYITFVSGYGATAADVPEAAKQAIKYLIRHRLENPGITSMAMMHDVDQTYRSIITRLHPGTYP